MKEITHIKSTEGACWQKGEISPGTGGDSLILTSKRKQKVLGFGGCFNELGWDALQKAGEKERNAFLDELFGEEGCNFNYGRVPIGANDFSLQWYSCDETPEDYELKDFNIERDKTYTIPFVKEAMARRKEKFPLFASPWSPPTWMKTKPVYNFGTLRQEEKVQKAYAQYFVEFVKAYAEQGLWVKQVMLQNEPVADQKYPSCVWTGPQMRDFIKNYWGPAFKESGLDTELWFGTINSPFLDMMLGGTPFGEFFDQMVNVVLSDKKAREYISGIGLQWGGKHILAQLEASWPDLPMMQTESECGDGENSWTHMEYVAGLMWQYFYHGAERYTYWNIALLADGVSTWGWRQNSLCAVDPAGGSLTLQPEFYLMKHYSHFVKPEAVYVPTQGALAGNTAAFENPDGSFAVIISNAMNEERKAEITIGEESFSAVLEPHSLHTFYLK